MGRGEVEGEEEEEEKQDEEEEGDRQKEKELSFMVRRKILSKITAANSGINSSTCKPPLQTKVREKACSTVLAKEIEGVLCWASVFCLKRKLWGVCFSFLQM